MKLLELLPKINYFIRIRRRSWKKEGYDYSLVKSEYANKGLIKIDIYSMQIGEYILAIDDLLADDWEVI